MRHTTSMIIVVEDDLYINELICELLTDEGYIAIGCLSGDEALSLIDTGLPDLVIVDLLLDGVQTGLSVLQQLRRQPHTKDIPVVMCSGAIDHINAIREEVQALHCAILEKPFDISDLITGVDAALSGSFEADYLSPLYLPVM
jgi:DNA-binding response OmpR family regulator